MSDTSTDGEAQTNTLEERGLDPSKDYTGTVPMRYSTKWIDHDNLCILAEEAALVAFGERVSDVEAALTGAITGNVNEDWMRSEFGHTYSLLKGELEEKAGEYRAEVFEEVKQDAE